MVIEKEQIDFWINFCIENYTDGMNFLESGGGSSSFDDDDDYSYQHSSCPTNEEHLHIYQCPFLDSFSLKNEEFNQKFGFEVQVKHGYDKIVFLSNKWDFVIKITFRSDSREPFVYQEAVSEGIAFVFPETISYKEVKVKRSNGDVEPLITVSLQDNCIKDGYAVGEKEYLDSHPLSEESAEAICDFPYKEKNFFDRKRNNSLGRFILSNFSPEVCQKIANFFIRFNINDLAERNYVITNKNRLLVFDFAGTYFFKKDEIVYLYDGDEVC